MALRAGGENMYQRILVPLNGSENSQKSLQEAIRLAQLLRANMRLIHVIEEVYPIATEGAEYLDNTLLLDALRKSAESSLAQASEKVQQAGIQVETAMLEDSGHGVVATILKDAQAWPAELIVIGTHGRSGIARLLMGSVAKGVIRDAAIPVLLVRS
jgi:nucleotide-binding universal stress UspA family protein